ncbi:hypothetical protein JOL62DRAFT_616738 [Phyllosticta paracitricarpa]|uniref:Uncharacterized protein n=1 Tax=Phyllosticta paracitricarpa TaxID=2016321 RepID=A0ABR1MTH5_9PEZI
MSSVFTFNPLAMPFVPTQKDDDYVDLPACNKPQSTPSRLEPTIANGSARDPVDRFALAVERTCHNSGVTEPFPYYTDPISGQVFKTSQPPPPKRNVSEKQEGEEDRATRPVDINMIVRLPLILKLVIVYKITPEKPYRVFTKNIFIHTHCSTNDTEGMVHEVIREDMRESIKKNDMPLKDMNAYACGRVDWKTKVHRQVGDAHDQDNCMGANTPLWFALTPQIRERLVRGQKVNDRDVTLRVTVTVFEGFPLRYLTGPC